MKFLKLTSILVLLLCMTTSVMAQSKFGLLEKSYRAQRISFFLNYGSFPIKIKENTVKFSYRDESPSPSTIEQIINLKGSTSANGLSGGFEWQTKRNIIFRVLFGGGKGAGKQTSASSFTFGVGYAFLGSSRLQIFPMVDFVGSSGSMVLGDLKGDGYVLINDVEFNSPTISTKLSTGFKGIKPALGLHYSITKKIGLNAHAGWLIGKASGTTKIEFTEPGQKDVNGNSTTTTASELLSESNVKFNVNGINETTRTSIFNAGGLTWSVGLTFNFKDRMRFDD